MLKCSCGFKFSGPGDFRNCEIMLTKEREVISICPKCDKKYMGGQEVEVNLEGGKKNE